jgi:Amt family ammonium transporter
MKLKVLVLSLLLLFIAGVTVPFTMAEDIPETQVGAKVVAVAEAEAEAPTIESNAAAIDAKGVALDTVWVLIAAVLVMFMQPGFALLEAGFTRAKNASNILMKNLMDFSLGSILYWVMGFGVMFGAGNLFFGTSGFFLNDSGGTFDSLSWSTVPLDCKYLFQLVFCATAATIVSGAMAERTKFASYLIYSVVISAVIYPVSGHWIWGGGWLSEIGMWDFAGSTVVHSVGGWLALVGAFILGPRVGKYSDDNTPRPIPGHNIPLAALGVFILWFGWFGFNPGSTMGAVTDIAHIAVTTNIAAAAGAISAMFTAWMLFKKPDASMSFNGVIAGLVAITAPCAFVSIGSAIIIGLVAGVLVVLSVVFIDRVLHIDDPVGAISAHGVCGAWGTFSLGLFARDIFAPGTSGDGLFFGGGWSLLGAQITGIVSIFAWCMITGFILFSTIKRTIGLRVTREEELRGLDIDEHGMEAYGDFQIFTTQ